MNRWRRPFQQNCIDAIVGPPNPWSSWWTTIIVFWATRLTPADFGFVRSRWTCETIAIVLREDRCVCVGREAVRRWQRREGLVYRRPQTVLGPTDPH